MSDKQTLAVASVGYEGRSADELVQLLVAADVDVLVDVRLRAEVDYLRLPALGNPRDDREPFRTGDLEPGVRRFRARLAAPGPEQALRQLEGVVKESSRRGVRRCSERDHDRCHRQVVCDALASRTGATVVRL